MRRDDFGRSRDVARSSREEALRSRLPGLSAALSIVEGRLQEDRCVGIVSRWRQPPDCVGVCDPTRDDFQHARRNGEDEKE